MSRLLIHVEGETEETFVNEVLSPHLYSVGWSIVAARLVGNARLRAKRGGIKPWSAVKGDILRHLHEDAHCYATTMVDYYALPLSWPGRANAIDLPMESRAPYVEAHLLNEIAREMGTSFHVARFIPFVVMHEFEALLFSDCEAFSTSIGRPDLHEAMKLIRDEYSTPEEINDSPHTAPSKRVEALFPGYQKPLFGTLAAIDVGLSKMRRECHHFNEWLIRLERIICP